MSWRLQVTQRCNILPPVSHHSIIEWVHVYISKASLLKVYMGPCEWRVHHNSTTESWPVSILGTTLVRMASKNWELKGSSINSRTHEYLQVYSRRQQRMGSCMHPLCFSGWRVQLAWQSQGSSSPQHFPLLARPWPSERFPEQQFVPSALARHPLSP